MSLSSLRASFAYLLLVLLAASPGSVTGFLPPQTPAKVARQPSLPPPVGTTSATFEDATSTQLYSASLGLRMGAVATRPLLLRTAAALPAFATATLPIFLACFSFGYATLLNNMEASKGSIPSGDTNARSCPLFTATTTKDATATTAASRSSSRLARPNRDLRLWALQRIGRRPVVSIRNTDLTAQVNKLEFVQTLALPAPDNGLLNTVDGNRHAYLRRLLQQAFTPRALSDAVPRLQQAARQSLESHVLQPIEKHPSAASLSIPELCEEWNLDTILSHYLGLSLGATEDIADLREAIKTYTRSTNPKRKVFPWKREASYRRRSRRQVQEARLYLESKIRDQMEVAKQHRGSSLLSQLIWASESTDFGINSLAEQEIIDNMLCLVVAGALSTTQTMIACLVEVVGQDPELYQRLVQEQRERPHGQPNLDAPCLNDLVDRALQLHPTTTSPRLVMEEVELTNGQKVPRGWLIKLDPSVEASSSYSSTQNNCNKQQKEGEIAAAASPFGEGPRACLGQSLALLQLKIFLATLAQNVDSFGVTSSQMDRIVLSNASTRVSTTKVVSRTAASPPAVSNLECPTSVTADWLKDALETSPDAFA